MAVSTTSSVGVPKSAPPPAPKPASPPAAARSGAPPPAPPPAASPNPTPPSSASVDLNSPNLPTHRQIDAAAQSIRHPIDPAVQINRLNGTGDSATFSVMAGGSLRVANPLTRVPVGPQASYGFDAKVTQTEAHKPGGPPTYSVQFGKNVQGGIGTVFGAGPNQSNSVLVTGELNLGSADRVTMRFDSKADAIKAVRLVEQTAVSQAVRDSKTLINPSINVSHPTSGASNPLDGKAPVGDPGGTVVSLPVGVAGPLSPVVGAVTGPAIDRIADHIRPTAAETAFLRDHITSYSTQLYGQARAGAEVSLLPFAAQARVTGYERITRTVTLPQDGKPGTLTYAAGGEANLDARERLMLKQAVGTVGALFPTVSSVADLGKATTDVTTSYTLSPQESATIRTTGGGGAAIEAAMVRDGRLAHPDSVEVKTQLTGPAQNPFIPTRTDIRQLTITNTVRHPTEHAAALIRGVMDGHVAQSLHGLAADGRTQMQETYIQRDGSNTNYDLAFAKINVFAVGVAAQVQVGTDHIAHTTTLLDTAPPPGTATPPPSHAPAPPHSPPNASATPNGLHQVVVTPREGVTVRTAPGTDANAASIVQSGSFLKTTGPNQADAAGARWTPVSGTDLNDKPVQGWVRSDLLQPHAAGAMDATGRTNPVLAHQGYQAVIVKPGDTVWSIAHEKGAAFDKTVALNSSHLLDPNLIFAGDTIFIPGTAAPPPVHAKQAPSATPAPKPAPVPKATSGAPTAAPSHPSPSGQTGSSSPAPAPAPSSSSSSSPRTLSGSQPQPVPVPTPPVPTASPSTQSPSARSSSAQSPSAKSGSTPNPTPAAPAPSTAPAPSASNAPPAPAPAPAATPPGRPDLADIRTRFQTAGDTTVTYTPHLGPFNIPGQKSRTMTATEAKLLDKLSLMQQNNLKNIVDRAYAVSEAQVPLPAGVTYPPGITTPSDRRTWVNNDGHRDAFRHAFWNASMARDFGQNWSSQFATAHEGMPSNPGDREAMDLYNNSIGRKIAADHPNASNEDLAKYVNEALNKGDLVVFDSKGNLAWSDKVPLWQHGQTNNVPGQGGNPVPNGDASAR